MNSKSKLFLESFALSTVSSVMIMEVYISFVRHKVADRHKHS